MQTQDEVIIQYDDIWTNCRLDISFLDMGKYTHTQRRA